MQNEHEHWLNVTNEPDYKRQHIFDPSISEDETVETILFGSLQKSINIEHITEIGCGFGRLTTAVRKRMPYAFITGIDINPVLIEEAKTNDPKGRYLARNTLAGIKNQSLIYSVAVFQHLPNIEKQTYVEQAYNSLASGGVLCIQFVSGKYQGFVNHLIKTTDMIKIFEDAGFFKVISQKAVHPRWTWVIGQKP